MNKGEIVTIMDSMVWIDINRILYLISDRIINQVDNQVINRIINQTNNLIYRLVTEDNQISNRITIGNMILDEIRKEEL